MYLPENGLVTAALAWSLSLGIASGAAASTTAGSLGLSATAPTASSVSSSSSAAARACASAPARRAGNLILLAQLSELLRIQVRLVTQCHVGNAKDIVSR